MKTVVVMDKHGRIVLPPDARRELGVDGETTLTLEIENRHAVLTPAEDIPPADAWAYTPEHLAQVEEAKRDVAEGRVYRLSESDLRRLVGLD